MTQSNDLDALIEKLVKLRDQLPKGVRVFHHDAEWGVYHTPESIQALKDMRIPHPTDEQLRDEWDEMTVEDRSQTMEICEIDGVDGYIALRKDQIASHERGIDEIRAHALALVMVARHVT